MKINEIFDPADSIEVIKQSLATLQHFCGQSTLTKKEALHVQDMALMVSKASIKIFVWSEKFSKEDKGE